MIFAEEIERLYEPQGIGIIVKADTIMLRNREVLKEDLIAARLIQWSGVTWDIMKV